MLLSYVRSNANYEFSLILAFYRLCDVIVATMSRMDRGTKPTFDGKSQGKWQKMAFGVIIQYLIRYYGYAFEKKCHGFEK